MTENSQNLHAADQQQERMWLKNVQVLSTIHFNVTVFSVFVLLTYISFLKTYPYSGAQKIYH